MNWNRLEAAAALALLVSACAGEAETSTEDSAETTDTVSAAGAEVPAGAGAIAELRDSSGAVVGRATLREIAGGVQVVVSVAGMEPGEHGVHVHAVGECDASGESPFESAGGHFNPDSSQHGLENPQGPHAGDLPNMTIGDGGDGALTATTERFTLASGERSLFDADGAAIVVHADPDDMTSDPAGNAGGRVACGVLQRT